MTTRAGGQLDALLDGEVEDVSAFAAEALSSLRLLKRPEVWTRVYERGLREAYRQHDMDGLAAVAALAVFKFDAQGALDQALSHIDFALAMANGLPDAVALLNGAKAPLLFIQGRELEAQQALADAQSAVAGAQSARAKSEYVVNAAVVSCMAVRAEQMDAIREAIGYAEQRGEHRLAAFGMSWLVPLMFAIGEKDAAGPWTHALRVHSEHPPHPYRLADALSFEFAAAASWGPVDAEAPVQFAAQSGNWLAGYRLRALRLRHSVLTGNWTGTHEVLTGLERLSTRMGDGYAHSVPSFAALLHAYSAPDEVSLSIDPPYLTLVNVAGLLAGAEAIAIAGTQRDAVRWLNWFEQSVPIEVRTSLEWPVARDRVVGLLRLRAGSVREAVRGFRDAIDWASKAGYEAEAALAQVQLAEVLSLSEIASSERARQRVRRAGWMKLQELNIDPTPHAYAATRALALRQDVASRPRLTPRQVEVLSLLAEGMTYRQAAEQLGTSWRTVSTQAYQAYDRLGASGKHDAVAAARQLGIL